MCPCGYAFRFDRVFFTRKGLAPPRRCRAWEQRRASRVRLSGVVVSDGVRFAVLEPDRAGPRCIAPAGLCPGTRVSWSVVDEPARPERMRQAFDVYLEE